MKHTYDIFISYRRDSGAQYARILQLMLSQRGYKVFLDYDELTDGRFGEHIKKAIIDAPIFMLVLSKEALVRCKNEGDWVRREIQLAISREKHIIPVNPDNSFDGIPDDIPEDIKNEVGTHQYSEISFGQTLGVTVDYMVTTRIVPQVGERTRQDSDIDVLKLRLSEEDKARKRHRLFIKSICLAGVLCALAIVALFGYEKLKESQFDQKRKNLIAQLQSHHPGLNLMANDTISLAQLKVLDGILNNMRDVYGDSIRFCAFETTEQEYYTILGEAFDAGEASLPVTNVSFLSAQLFIGKLNEMINSDKSEFEFAMPTKKEWEYAASGGNLENATAYAGGNNIDEVAWYKGNSDKKPHSANGQNELRPNEFELYDMSGNVCEHVFTRFVNSNNPESITNMMLIKGGSYASDSDECTIGFDIPMEPDLASPKVGIRLVLRKKEN